MKFILPLFIIFIHIILVSAVIFLLRFFHADVTSSHFWLNGLYGLYVCLTCVLIMVVAVGIANDFDDATDVAGAAVIMSIILALWTYAKFF